MPHSTRPLRHAVAALAVLLTLAPTALAQEAIRAGVVAEVRDAGLQRFGTQSTWLAAGDEIIRNAALQTDRLGELAVDMDDGSHLTLSSDSEIVIDRFVYDPDAEDGASVLTLARGALRMITGRMPSDRYEVRTNVVTIGVRGTDFTAEVLDPERVYVSVERGAVAVTARAGGNVFLLRAGSAGICTASGCREVDGGNDGRSRRAGVAPGRGRGNAGGPGPGGPGAAGPGGGGPGGGGPGGGRG